MKILNPIIIFLLSIILACYGGTNDEAMLPGDMGFDDDVGVTRELSSTKSPQTGETTENIENLETVEKKIIKTADVSIEVDDFKEARNSLDKILKKHKAYVSNEKQNNYDYEISSSLTIRISSANFDSLLNEVCGLANKIASKEIRLSDVTEEFIDITARLKNKKQVEQQYLELLKRAKTINEILQVNEHLRVIREEIESKEGRLKYLQNQVSYSTINLYMFEKTEHAYTSFGERIVNGLEGGWKGILAFIIGLAYLWPLLLVVAALLWFFLKRRKKKKQLPAK